MFKYFTFLFCVLSLGIFTGCETSEKEPSGSVIYFRNIIAKAEATDVGGYAPVKNGTNIACLKNGAKYEAKLKITAQKRFDPNILIKNTKLLIQSVDAVYTKSETPVQASNILTKFETPISIDFDQSADLTVTVRYINSEPVEIPADAIYKYKLSFDVIGTERLLGQSDYTGLFTALWGNVYIVGKNVDCAEAIKK